MPAVLDMCRTVERQESITRSISLAISRRFCCFRCAMISPPCWPHAQEAHPPRWRVGGAADERWETIEESGAVIERDLSWKSLVKGFYGSGAGASGRTRVWRARPARALKASHGLPGGAGTGAPRGSTGGGWAARVGSAVVGGSGGRVPEDQLRAASCPRLDLKADVSGDARQRLNRAFSGHPALLSAA